MKKPFLLLLAAVVVALVWFLWPRHELTEVPSSSASVASNAPKAAGPSTSALPSSTPVAPPLEISHLADQLNAPTGDIRADLKIVRDVLENFRTNFPHDGNPVGDNAEITAVLTGKNKLRYAAVPPNHPAINQAGELCDRWGTPFFFHAESGTKMGVRSAGPDKKMWTADDVVVEP